jgi:hypothetical protein
MQMRGKILALLRAGWDKLVSGLKIVVDPPPGAIGWYILAVLGIAIGGNVLLGTLFHSPKAPPAKPVVVAKRPVYALPPLSIITTVPPAKTAKAEDAKPKKKLYRKKEAACSWPFC